MWQRCPNMFLPLFPSHLPLLPLPAFVNRVQSQRGVLGEWWADCMTVMSEVSVSQHSLTHTYTRCTCVCVRVCIYNSSAHVAKDVESCCSTSRTCNVQNFWSELNAVFLAASHAASQQMGWVQPKVEWSRFFGGVPGEASLVLVLVLASSSTCVCILRCMHSLCTAPLAPLACLPIRFLAALQSVLPACNFVGIFLGKMSINARVQLIKRLSNVATSQRQQGEAIINSKSPE